MEIPIEEVRSEKPENQLPPKTIADKIKKNLFIVEVPSYGNKVFYSLGFLALTCLATLILSGIVMVFFAPTWWLTSSWGVFFRSIHLWAAQAFIAIIILHALVVFSTSGFKAPRRLTWMLGAAVFTLALGEAEFGYGLRGDFSSQYRPLQAADFFNGAFLGKLVNTLNFSQIYGMHIIDVPLAIAALVFFHYLLVKVRGIAKPYRSDIKPAMVPADHRKLFIRGGVLVALIILFAYISPSPFIPPAKIEQIAKDDPSLLAQTLMKEFTKTSDTATYLDSIDPYTYDTRKVYVSVPYEQYVAASHATDDLAAFNAETSDAQKTSIGQANAYFGKGGEISSQPNANPLIPAVSSLVVMAKSGLYEAVVDAENKNLNPTYSLRLLDDTGVLDAEATRLHISTEQWGMMRPERGVLPPGAWWLAPLGFLSNVALANDPNADRDGAAILGFLALLLIVFPYIPYLNRIPEKLHIAEIIWKR
ncbi:MAG TPA: cytochrome b N-terminal domain-containing protein [Patescibacteria group bacterium]|nr:cytochrome b N-terminal domain-containing protein [Patescibacteria group bacterium]